MIKEFLVPFVMALAFSACSILPQNETGDARGEIARVYISVELLADQIGTAQQQGLIDTEEEDRLLDMLEAAVVSASVVESAKNEGLEVSDRMEKIRKILDEVRANLKSGNGGGSE